MAGFLLCRRCALCPRSRSLFRQIAPASRSSSAQAGPPPAPQYAQATAVPRQPPPARSSRSPMPNAWPFSTTPTSPSRTCLQLAQAQVVREARSAELPGAIANLTAVDAHDNTRITAGALNNPIVYPRAAAGLTVGQLITDFGRTHNLVKSAQSNTKAQIENERATVQDITLAVDQAFYQALTAQSISESCATDRRHAPRNRRTDRRAHAIQTSLHARPQSGRRAGVAGGTPGSRLRRTRSHRRWPTSTRSSVPKPIRNTISSTRRLPTPKPLPRIRTTWYSLRSVCVLT